MTPEAFWSRVDASGDCWEWTGAPSSGGYGRTTVTGRLDYAHRVAWMTLVGPIPAGLELDHLCRNRMCVNPDHLEPVARRTNILRGASPSALHARSDTCPYGHLKDAVRASGTRWCRTCDRLRYKPEARAARYRRHQMEVVA